MKNSRTHKAVQWASIATIAVVLSATAACSSSSSGTKASAGNGSDPAAAATAKKLVDAGLAPQSSIGIDTPLAKRPTPGRLAYYIRFNIEGAGALADQIWPEATAKVGWKGKVVAVDPTDPQAMSNGMKQAIAAGAKYIGVNSASTDSIKAGLDAAKAAGVPVFAAVTVGDAEGATNGLYGSVAGLPGVVDFGSLVMDYAIADSNGTASVLWINYPDAPIVGLQEPGVKKQFEQNCPKCTFTDLDMSTAQLTDGSIKDAIVSELRKNPSIKYVATQMAPNMVGLRQMLDNAGLKDVKLAIAGAVDSQLDGLRKGEYDIVGEFPNADMYYAQLDQMLRYDQGMDVLNQQYASLPVQLFDQKSVGSTKTWDGPEGYADQYAKLWKVS